MEPLKSATPPWKRLARMLLPSRMQEHVRELRELSGPERREHMVATLQRVGPTRDAVPHALDEHGTILFVCYGNIIRSALAAELTRRHARALRFPLGRVESAGLAAKPGRAADARAISAGKTLGVDLESHRAQPLTDRLVSDATVIYVMDRLNEAKLRVRFPSAAGRVRMLGRLTTEEPSYTIEDPYVLDAAAVAAVAERIDRATRALVETLARRRAAAAGGSP